MVTFIYPGLPPREFSRNSRAHHMVLHKVQEQVNDDVYMLLMEAGWKPGTPLERAVVAVEFVLPDKRRRDPDNLQTTLKPIWDALVRHGVIKDDCLECIGFPKYSFRYADDKKAATIITIRGVETILLTQEYGAQEHSWTNDGVIEITADPTAPASQ